MKINEKLTPNWKRKCGIQWVKFVLCNVKSSLKCFLYAYSLIKNRSNMQKWLPQWLSGKESTCLCTRHKFDPGLKDPPEKEMATHSSIFAWKIPWTEEPGKLQSMGSQRVRHNWATEDTCMHAQSESCFSPQIYKVEYSIIFQKWEIFIKDNTNWEKVFH